MMFLFFTILLILRINTLKMKQEIVDDIFYDQNYYFKNIAKKNLENDAQKLKIKPNIKSLTHYLNQNKAQMSKIQRIYIEDKGNSTRILNIKDIFNSTILSDLEKFLFEKNHIFVDENENIIIYSSCNNIYNKNCNFKFVFVSKIDYSFYEMAIVGDALPRLSGYAIDYNRRVFYVNIDDIFIWRNRLRWTSF